MNRLQDDIDEIIAVLDKEGPLAALTKVCEIEDNKGSEYLSEQVVRKVKCEALKAFIKKLGGTAEQASQLSIAIVDKIPSDNTNPKDGTDLSP